METNDETKKHLNVFTDTFGDMLIPQENLKQQAEARQQAALTPPPKPEGELHDILFGPPETPETETTKEQHVPEVPEDYVPPYVGDPDWEAFTERLPQAPLSREDEANAVRIGLQEIRKMKEFMFNSYHHLTNEFNRVYALFPLSFSKDFDEAYSKTHKDLFYTMDDLEHLIAGDYDNVEAVKKDFTLTQEYDEKRLSLLHAILAYYKDKN